MDFKVIIMPLAIRDLEDITARIAINDSIVAERFGYELIDQALSLSKFPRRGRVVPEFGDATIREIIHSPHRIIYRLRHGRGNFIFCVFGTPLAVNPFSEPTQLKL